MARLGDAVERMRVRGVNFATEDAGMETFLNELESGSNGSIGFCGSEFALKLMGVSENSFLKEKDSK